MPPPKDPEKLKLWRERQSAAQKRVAKIGVLNPCFKPRITKICPICGNSFEDTPRHAEDRICCSNDCATIRRGRLYLGENNPFYGKTHSDSVKNLIREMHIGTTHSTSTKQKMSDKKKGIPHTKEHSENIGKALTGREITWTDKISASHQGLTLEEWEGYITPLHLKIRSSPEYFSWRNAIFERDDFCDWFSGVKGNGNLNAHHVVPFSVILERHGITTFEDALKCEALWDIHNGVTMIDTNHAAHHTMWG